MLVYIVQVLLIASALPGVFSQAILPCRVDEDCGNGLVCFFEGTPEGACVCNVETNAGCRANEVCSFPPGLVGAPPTCSEQGDIGSDCQTDSDCESGVCFFSETSQDYCVCNDETNAGCEGDEVCTYDPDIVGAGGVAPFCSKLLLPIFSNCDADSDCESGVCFFAETSQDFCVCNEETNAGCNEGEVCQYPPDIIGFGVPPQCVDGLRCFPWSFQLNGGGRVLLKRSSTT